MRVVQFKLSRHAIQQYRDRVLGCPERKRSDAALGIVVAFQIARFPMVSRKGTVAIEVGPYVRFNRRQEPILLNVTHRFVIADDSVVTTLGYRMRPGPARKFRARRARSNKSRGEFTGASP